MKHLFAAVAAATLAMSGVNAGTLVNGSLNGPIGPDRAPTGWATENTVDINSTAFQAFPLVVNPGDSPDGGTWAGLASNVGFRESITQTVSDFAVGSQYTIEWYATNTGEVSTNRNEKSPVFLELDGTNVFTSAPLPLDGNWYLQSYSFTAAKMVYDLTFGITAGPNAYLGIDGITLTQNPIPVPAAAPLMLAGLAALGLRRRRTR